MDFKLPDIGEGVHEGEIVKWLVKEGDIISEDQPLVEVMTDKATVEIPSPAKGKILKIYYKEGDVVKVESIIVTIQEEGDSSKPVQKEASRKTLSPEIPRVQKTQSPEVKEYDRVLVMPAIRKLAKDLGVSLENIRGTGSGGIITEADVRNQKAPVEKTVGGGERFLPLAIPRMGTEERLSIRGIRKTIAHHLQMSKYFAPHFTYVEEVDVTDLVSLRNAKKNEAQKRGIKLTYLAYIMKGLIPALREFPFLNASLDETTQEIVLKKYYHIGFAVATEEGLIVPVVKDVDKKSLYEVATEVDQLSERVRNHKAKPEDLKGSSFTVTSIGSIGGVFATPILNYPDVAILGVNKIVERPVIQKGKIVPRHMLYLSMTLDHRVVDGAVAATFMNKVVDILQHPETIS